MTARWRNDISLSAILLGVIWSRDASYWRHKTLKDNTTAGSIYHHTFLRLLFPVRMQKKKKLLITFGTTLVEANLELTLLSQKGTVLCVRCAHTCLSNSFDRFWLDVVRLSWQQRSSHGIINNFIYSVRTSPRLQFVLRERPLCHLY